MLPSRKLSRAVTNCARKVSHVNVLSLAPPCRRQSTSSAKKPASIFDLQSPSWDHVFNDVKDMPPLLPNGLRNGRPQQRARRQAMTEREINAFEDMFNMIFTAVSKKTPNSTSADPHVGVRKQDTADLFGSLRRHSKSMRWTSESDEQLDQLKEAMDLCETDQQLLQWAMREIFGESTDSTQTPEKAPSHHMLQSPTYPHLLAYLIRTFRDKYQDPYLALSMFDYARHLSIASYVFGCSTMAYNELLQTRWQCFKDLKGFHDAMQEMSVNGVDYDSRTKKLVETVRREVGERNMFMEEDALGGGEVREMVAKIERLTQTVAHDSSSTPDKSSKWDEWKTLPMADEDDDDWGFDRWEPREREQSF